MQTVVKIKFGSHLYGTNTPESDLDYKSVYIPDAEDILLQRVKGSIKVGPKKTAEREKNQPSDVDEESYSLQKFLQLCAEGQTVAIDMLFAPDENIVESSSWWRHIQFHRNKLICKKSTAFVGYCRTQANKYGIKGSRVAAAKVASEFFKNEAEWRPTQTVRFFEETLYVMVKQNRDHMALVDKEHSNGKTERYFECCNRQVPFSASVKVAAEIYTKIYENYGNRARLAQNNEGIDWKALSHAVRVGQEALELLRTGKITFPLPYQETLKDIKLGKLSYDVVADMIERSLVAVEEASEKSTLPDEVDRQFIDKLVVNAYGSTMHEDCI